jgi:ribosomal protein L24E
MVAASVAGALGATAQAAGACDAPPAVAGIALTPSGDGYFTVDYQGQVFALDGAQWYGNTPPASPSEISVAIASSADGKGYWVAAQNGAVHARGDSPVLDPVVTPVTHPIVGMAATPSHNGYWRVASDGGIFSSGDATFLGSTGAMVLNQPIVGMAATPDGHGYWLVAADGGIFSFGSAHFFGSTGAIHLNQPIVGMAATPDGQGYWMVAADGGIFSFGSAKYFGSGADPSRKGDRIAGIAASKSGNGYLLEREYAAGWAESFGDAPAEL